MTVSSRSVLVLSAFVAALTIPVALPAQEDLWPGVSYSEEIPTLESVVGHGVGERISSHAELMRYFEALAEAAPDRLKTWEYGRSYQGRELIYAAVGSAETLSRLEQIEEDLQKLADPTGTDADAADALIERLPAVVWLAYAVHGNEISTSDAAAMTAYHLLAAENDPVVDNILENTVVFIDPVQNPDGRDRFVHHYRSTRSADPVADRISAEHDEPWPGCRTNHYLFDLNRDWFALTQPETRGRIEVLRRWLPQVFVDLHEMGGDSTYYFAPEAVPYNPHLAADQRSSLELFGRNNAKWFDEYGFDYFTREIFDAFYPGYGASWPAYFGSVSMTYEQASARALVYRRSDGDLLHFRDTVRHHFVASVSTAEAAAIHREKLLRDFYDYGVSAVAEGKDEGQFVLPYRRDTTLVDKLAGLLTMQGVEVHRALDSVTACGSEVPAGSYVVPLDQRAKRLVRNLLDPEVPMDQDFLAEQERRRARRLRDQIYDVTSWSLPLMWNLEALRCKERLARTSPSSFEPAAPEWVRPGKVSGGQAKVAYLVPWGTVGAVRLLASALVEGYEPLSPDESFTQAGRTFPAGTLVFKVEDHGPELGTRLAEMARETGAEVVAADSSWVDAGMNWGSNQVVKVHAPRIALAWDEPTSGYSAGATRYLLERKFGYPVTPIRVSTLARSDLSRYQVLILPGSWGGYSRALGGAADRLSEWVRAGGTLISFDSATSFLALEEVDLLGTRQQSRSPTADQPDAGVLETADDLLAAIQPVEERPDNVAGVLLRASVDLEHWLSAGLPSTLQVLFSGTSIYDPIKIDRGVNVVSFVGPEEVLASGYLWEENRLQLAYKPFVLLEQHGRGLVIGFTGDPTTRAYVDGLDVLVANAIFRGAAHARPLR
ncbi:MAG: M14 metallopeptidase family protein [Acidobacteriota bacterium]